MRAPANRGSADSVFASIAVLSAFFLSASATSIDILAPDSGDMAGQLALLAGSFNAQQWALGNNVRIIHAANVNENLTLAVDVDLRREKRLAAYVVVVNKMPTWARDGLLADLSSRVQMDPMLEWGDVLPLVKYVLTTVGGHVYTMPLDADHLMGFARMDVLDEHNLSITALQTWDDFLEAAQALNGSDMNGDGVADFAICMPTSLTGMYTATFVMAIMAPFVQVRCLLLASRTPREAMHVQPQRVAGARNEARHVLRPRDVRASCDRQRVPCGPADGAEADRAVGAFRWTSQLGRNTV